MKVNSKFIPPISIDMLSPETKALIDQTKGYELLALLVYKSVMSGLGLTTNFINNGGANYVDYSVATGRMVYQGEYNVFSDTGVKRLDADTRYTETSPGGGTTQTLYGRRDYLICINLQNGKLISMGGTLAKIGEVPKVTDISTLPEVHFPIYTITINGIAVSSKQVFSYTKSNDQIWEELKKKVDVDTTRTYELQVNELKATLDELGIVNFINKYEKGYFNNFKNASEVDAAKTSNFTISGGSAKMDTTKDRGTLTLNNVTFTNGYTWLELYLYLNDTIVAMDNEGVTADDAKVMKLSDPTLRVGDLIYIDNVPYRIQEVLK